MLNERPIWTLGAKNTYYWGTNNDVTNYSSIILLFYPTANNYKFSTGNFQTFSFNNFSMLKSKFQKRG